MTSKYNNLDSFSFLSILLRLCFLIHWSNSAKLYNENGVITFDDWDHDENNLEMIQKSKQHSMINQKLEEFHNFIRRTKVVKHPWEKEFVKDTEYKKSEFFYMKHMRDTINKMRNFNRLQRKRKLRQNSVGSSFAVKFYNPFYVEKRQLPVKEGNKNDDNDDYDDDEEYIYEGNRKDLQHVRNLTEYISDYKKQVLKSKEELKAFRYSEQGKPEEGIKDAFEKIIDMKIPKNCTNMTGFGVQSVECLFKNYKTHEMTNKQLFSKFLKILLAWIEIYVFVALPLWCVKGTADTGWGCCCFTCKFCHPRKSVKEIQKYLAMNPPGVYVNDEGVEEHYAPSIKEKELYDKINKSILHF